MRRLFLLIIAALPVPALAAPATTKAVIPADLEAQVAQGRDHCRKAVYRYYSQIPMGPKRGFSISDVNVEVNPIVLDRLAKYASAKEAIRSAGISYLWSVEVQNSRGHCDLPPSERTLIKAEPFFEQAEKQPRIVFSDWEPK